MILENKTIKIWSSEHQSIVKLRLKNLYVHSIYIWCSHNKLRHAVLQADSHGHISLVACRMHSILPASTMLKTHIQRARHKRRHKCHCKSWPFTIGMRHLPHEWLTTHEAV